MKPSTSVVIGRKPAKHAAKPKANKQPKIRPAPMQAVQHTDFTDGVDVPAIAKTAPMPARKPGFQVDDALLAWARGNKKNSRQLAKAIFEPAKPFPGVVPAGNATLAMDSSLEAQVGWAANSIYAGAFQQGVTFMGYPYLSELATRAEYRRISETVATEMTRKWIKIKAASKKVEVDTDNDEVAEQNEKVFGQKLKMNEKVLKAPLPHEVKPTANDAFPPAKAEGEQESSANSDDQTKVTLTDKDAPPGFEDQEPEDAAEKAEAEEKDERVKELEDEFERLGVQAVFKQMAEYDGFMGRAHLFIDVKPGAADDEPGAEVEDDEAENPDEDEGANTEGDAFEKLGEQADKQAANSKPTKNTKASNKPDQSAGEDPADADGPFAEDSELMMPIGDGQNKITQAKIAKGSIKRLKAVEAVWCYPADYNSNNPLRPDWYKPNTWFVMGKQVHHSRLLTFIGREVPDMLKPAYSFGGLSLSQMAKPCVDNWLRTRQSVGDIVQAFSVFVLKTNMSTSTMEDGQQVYKRAEFFNLVRSNTGMMMLDKESEEFENVAAPLSTLDALQAQSQEHICSVTGIPLVKYTGISPAGLNASSDGEIRVWYDWIAAYQQALFHANLTRIFHFAQMNIWGKIDPDLSFEFVKLWELTEKEAAEMRKAAADTDKTLIDAGVLNPEDARKRLAEEEDGPYSDIDVNDVPAPAPEMGDPFGQRQPFDPSNPAGGPPGGPPGGGAIPPAGAKPAGPNAGTAQPEV